MPIPPLDEDGFLPPGIHDCTLEEVGERFATLGGSERRVRLFAKLQEYVRDVRRTGMAVALVIDGSFVTDKPDPSDIDLVLLLRRDHDFTLDLRPFEYNTLSRAGVRRIYRFDLFAFCEDTEACRRQTEFFQRVREDEERRKGILRVRL